MCIHTHTHTPHLLCLLIYWSIVFPCLGNNSDALHPGVHMYFQITVLSGCMPRGGIAGSTATLFVVFEEPPCCSTSWLCPFVFLPPGSGFTSGLPTPFPWSIYVCFCLSFRWSIVALQCFCCTAKCVSCVHPCGPAFGFLPAQVTTEHCMLCRGFSPVVCYTQYQWCVCQAQPPTSQKFLIF